MKDALRLPAGTPTPNKADALRQERLSLARTGGAVPTPPCRPKGSAPPMSGGRDRLSCPITSQRRGTYSYADVRASETCIFDGSVNYSLGGDSSDVLAAPTTSWFARGSADSTGGCETTTSPHCGAARVSLSDASVPLSSSTDSAMGKTVAYTPTEQGSFATRSTLPASSSIDDRRGWSDAMQDSGAGAPVWDRPAMQQGPSVSELAQRPGSSSTLSLFSHGGDASLLRYRLSREASASMSMLHETPSVTLCNAGRTMSTSEITTVPHLEEGVSGTGFLPSLQDVGADRWTVGDATVDGHSAEHRVGEGGRRHEMRDRPGTEWSSFLSFDTTGERYTPVLFSGVVSSVAEDTSRVHAADAAGLHPIAQSRTGLDTSGPIRCTSATFMLSGTAPPAATEGLTRDPDVEVVDGRSAASSAAWGEAQSDGGGAEGPVSVVDGLRSVESFLRHFCSMRVDPAPHPPAATSAPACQRPAGSEGERRYPLPLVADTTDTSADLPKVTESLQLRYLFPQPELAGPRLPELPKVDPRLSFGGDCIASAPWVSSPQDVNLDGDDNVIMMAPPRRRRRSTARPSDAVGSGLDTSSL
ncbi:hypothetical protein STCU_10014 [Strigomonas culicis]|uniref:Proteophosphoglycan ppg4 n=1 Tax=Strigomonas culicis TaxID=28005 RepID=S9UV06_9TRYP|nr:hypothetical protein STCU_10014 [Strigomonas culicis]|eukprot:EPY18361.1 hypothetical protein STCU_10014 [Strigomonas culicis]